jgi:hypothetical protein
MNSSRIINYDDIEDKYDIGRIISPAMENGSFVKGYRGHTYSIPDYTHNGKLGTLQLKVSGNGSYEYMFVEDGSNVTTLVPKSNEIWNSIRGNIEKVEGIKFKINTSSGKALEVSVKVDGSVEFEGHSISNE